MNHFAAAVAEAAYLFSLFLVSAALKAAQVRGLIKIHFPKSFNQAAAKSGKSEKELR